MEPKKNSKKLLIVIIILIVLILVTGVAFAFFATDLFKNDKKMFFKYVAQMGDEKEGFIDNRLKQYFEKQKTTPYNNQGTFTPSIEGDNEEQYKSVNDFNISFSGQTDKANQKATQEISLNYTDDVNFPVNYKKIGNTIGLQTKYVGSKHIAVETDKLENKEMDDVNDILESTKKMNSLTELPFSKEELQKLQETYSEVINNALQEEQFAKVQEDGSTGYKLSINKQQFNQVVCQVLENLKSDQNTLDKLNEYAKKQQNSAKITATTIDNYIKSIEEDTEESDVTWEITVWQQKGKITKLSIANPKNAVELTIEKKKEGDSLQYKAYLTVNDEEDDTRNVEVIISASYNGLNEMQSVKEEYSIEWQVQEPQTTTVKYQFQNQVDFTDSIEIEEFSNKNAMILSNYEEEKVSSFMEQVVNRISEVNKKQMEELGLQENENPIIQMFSPILGMNSFGQSNSAINDIGFSAQEIEAFNTQFENYVGTKLSGASVKGLLSAISLNNENAEEDEEEERKIKEIHFDGEEYEVTDQNIAFIKDSIELETEYRVEVEKDENTGRIYRIVINKK